jgi:hypothetical protein
MVVIHFVPLPARSAALRLCGSESFRGYAFYRAVIKARAFSPARFRGGFSFSSPLAIPCPASNHDLNR